MSSIDLNNSLIEELKKIKIKNKSKEEFSDYKQQEKQKLINEIKGIDKQRKKLKKRNLLQNQNQNKNLFQECIKNKTIPKDTPEYLRKALERAIKEHQVCYRKKSRYYTKAIFERKIFSNRRIFQSLQKYKSQNGNALFD